MEKRFNMAKTQSEAYRALAALDKFINSTEITSLHREMIKIRASQINGCAYCVNQHTHAARKLGETEQRIYLMSVWREAGDLFSEEEMLLLEMTEEITRISDHGLSDIIYDKAISLFGEIKTAQVIMAVIIINAWNRIGVSLHMQPEHFSLLN